MPAERVVIDIEVNSDIATIVATRRALEDLTDAQRRYNRERDREPRGGGGGGGGSGGDDDGSRGRRGGRGGGGGGRRTRGRYDGFGGQVFDFRGDVGKMIGMYGKLLKLVNKLAMISLPLMMAVLGGIALAFQAGTYFVNMYRAAMSSMASAVGVAYVALTTLLAAQREFSAVQNSPAYAKGSLTTTDRFIASSEAMSMFVGNSELAVVSAKSLQSSFTTLSKVSPITGKTTAAFTSLMDVVAGSGGDLDKGTEKLATFLAEVQKKGTLAGGAEAAKDLGPDFEKIVKEASALGIKTSEEFLKAAAEGKLGETFATKYAGTLDALNNTVMGRFKGAISSIKEQLTDLGGQYLGETGGAISRLQGIISTFITRLSYVMQSFDISGKMGSALDMVEKGADKMIVLMNKYLGTTPGIFGFLGDSFKGIGNAFDAMQDWMRQFQKAGELINQYFFQPLFNAMGNSFTASMKDLAGVIENSAPAIESFATQLGNTLVAIGKYGDTIRRLFIGALPFFAAVLKLVELFFKGLDKFGEAAIKIGDIFAKLGPLGRLAGQLVKVAALYALFTLATRFFKVFGTMFGRKIPAMNIQAGIVNVNGGMGLSPGQMAGKGYMSASQKAMSFGRSTLSKIPGGGRLASAGGKIASAGSRIASGGIMAPLAIAGGAYMAGSAISGKFNDDSVTSRGMSAGASALAGAAIGATIGSFVPIIGTGIGAAIGAAIGGVTGYLKAGKQRKETRKAAESLLTNFSESVDEAIAGGNVDDLLQARTDMIDARNKLISENADPAYAAQAVAKYDEQFEKLNTNIKNYTNNVGLSEKYFDTGAESLNKLAEEAGVNLKDKMLNFREVLSLVGETAEDQARLLKAAWLGFTAGIVNPVFDFFDKQAQEREQGTAVNAARNKLIGGDAGVESRQDFLKKALQYNVGKSGDIMGLINTFAQLELDLGQGGMLENLTSDQKNALRSDLRLAGGTPDEIVKRLTPEQLQNLAEMSGGINNMGGLLNQEGLVDPAKLKTLLTAQTKINPLFLQRFIENASNPDKVIAGARMDTLLKGTGYEGASTSGGAPDRMVPPAQGTQNYVAQTTINAAMLDKGTVDQIERAIAKALKEQRERGMVPVTGGTVDSSRS